MKLLQDRRRLALVYGWVVLGWTAVIIALRCVNIFCFFDSDIGYFQSNAILPVLADAMTALGAVIFAAAGILLFAKSELAPADTPSLALRIASGVATVGFFALVATDVLYGGSVWSAILGMGACLFFLLNITKSGTPLVHVLSGLCVILRLIWILAKSYFDVTVQMNAPEKLALHLACVFGMLMTVSDLRAAVGKLRPAIFGASFALGTLFLGVASLPTVIASLGGAWAHDAWLPETYALVALFVYAAVRLMDYLLFPVPLPKPLPEPEAEEAIEEAVEEATEEAAEETTTEEIEIPEEVKEEAPTEEPNDPPEQET